MASTSLRAHESDEVAGQWDGDVRAGLQLGSSLPGPSSIAPDHLAQLRGALAAILLWLSERALSQSVVVLSQCVLWAHRRRHAVADAGAYHVGLDSCEHLGPTY